MCRAHAVSFKERLWVSWLVFGALDFHSKWAGERALSAASYTEKESKEMARANERLIEAITKTIESISSGAGYQWGHMGMCNCGHLVQALTRRSQREIHQAALLRAGDWGQQSIDYCPTSGLPLDAIISEMLEAGLTLDDINYLERLNDPRVLARLPLEERWLKRNRKEDLVTYLETWRAMLCEELEHKQHGFIRELFETPRLARSRQEEEGQGHDQFEPA